MKTNMRWRGIGVACVVASGLCATATAFAQDAGNATAADTQSTQPRASEVGHSTLNWLELQRSGEQAAPPLAMLGDEAGLAYQRYMESFKAKIPVSFGSSVGGGGNQLHVDYTNSGGAQ
ncbi:DUF3613 domain-containing protein [Burkholderia sp. Ac-20365]|uniref:DUF3613 domain-containing protein n=1 Tax=Burkholderia sp. Ac-20365 TaxID=2703897 RepID=UPI00197B92E8|nr:DUF3613 domain-containing protein [Burkholderia sp. Ac-20365]MBN3766769.1 DUF3613 domain-containing protein [Burkholderia sp. Ac-20365]